MCSNYPPGAEHDPNAPYNQHDPEVREVEVVYTCTLSKQDEVGVDDYEYWEDLDEDGGCCGFDYSGCDLNEAWDNDHYTPSELLDKTVEIFEELLKDNPSGFYNGHNLKHLISECKGWEIDEKNIELS